MPEIPEITIRYFHIDVADIVFIKAVLESYEGMVVVRTLEGHKQILELLIAHDFQETIAAVIQDLRLQVKLEETEKPEPSAETPSSP